MNDVLNDALSNLEHDNYELSYQGYKDRQADIALIRAALAAHKPDGGDVQDARRYRWLKTQMRAMNIDMGGLLDYLRPDH